MSLTTSILHLIVSAISLLLTAYLVRGIKVRNFLNALLAAIVIGIVNTFIWPAMIFLTLPINILTLGLFTFVVNGAVLKISAAVLPGFEIESWLAAIFGAIVLTLVSSGLHHLLV